MKVKVLQLDDRFKNHTEEEEERIGKIFNALQFEYDWEKNEKYKKMYEEKNYETCLHRKDQGRICTRQRQLSAEIQGRLHRQGRCV